MQPDAPLPTVILICHEQDSFDREGLARWLACTMRLAGIVVIADDRARWRRVVRRELRRAGVWGFADVVAFRVYQHLCQTRRDTAWKQRALERLRREYPADLDEVPSVVVRDPNSEDARRFIAGLAPDLIIARCKFILTPAIFGLARQGAFALHPGICPEYRNAHGCFWALANRDLGRVGMTLLRIDRGVDTGPIYLQAGVEVDELRESHTVIQYRAVLDNLDVIGQTLLTLGRGEPLTPLDITGRHSAAWGQPRLSAHLRWKRTARRQHQGTQAQHSGT